MSLNTGLDSSIGTGAIKTRRGEKKEGMKEGRVIG